jgi:hypothetical protein
MSLKRLLPVAGFTLGLLAQGTPEEAFFERVYGKLSASFATGDSEFLLLAHPGLSLDAPDEVAAATLADKVPLPAERYTPGLATYSDTFQNVLSQSETTAFQNMAHRNQALMAQRVLWDRRRPNRPTPAYAAYLKHQQAYEETRDALALARAEQRASGRPVPPGLERRVAEEMREWEARGAKEAIEEAQETIRRVSDENLRVLFYNLRMGLSMASRNDPYVGEYYPVVTEPPVEAWLDEDGWLPFAFSQKESRVASDGPALAPGKEAKGALPKDFLGSVSLTVETKRVSISRPWFDEGIFRSHGWRFFQAGGFTRVSSGNPADPDPGMMPILVTGLLLARNLRMQGAWGGPPDAEIASAGPFNLRGPWTPTGDTLHTNFSFQHGTLTLVTDGAQVLGFFCRPIPKSPDPDPRAFRYP